MYYPEWQAPYIAALAEADAVRKITKLNQAEAAMLNRLKALPTTARRVEKRNALDDAIRNLRALKSFITAR